MTLHLADGGAERVITMAEKEAHLRAFLDGLPARPKRVLLLPPDHTRLYSDAGPITDLLYKMLAPEAEVEIMPALGTHAAMREDQLRMMFGEDIPLDVFRVHDWRNDVVEAGVIPGAELRELSGGKVDYDMKVMVNKLLLHGGHDLILSIGQIVPHEVVGMANYTKNLCVGVGGADMINKSHFLGAACNMESILGRTESPVRSVFNRAFDRFLAHLPVHFIMTVVEEVNHAVTLRGLYISDDASGFEAAAALSRQVNLTLLDKPIRKAVVYLDPREFGSTWLGNKAVYRTRMAMADEGELIILAPGVHEFGEDPGIDKLIRAFGYRGTPATLAAVEAHPELRENLSAAAHLIHGSSEGRFSITYCTDPTKLSRAEVEGVGFRWADYHETVQRYDPATLRQGENEVEGETIFFIGNPALGLWAPRAAFA